MSKLLGLLSWIGSNFSYLSSCKVLSSQEVKVNDSTDSKIIRKVKIVAINKKFKNRHFPIPF